MHCSSPNSRTSRPVQGHPFMMLSLHYCSFQLLFAGRKTEAKIISTLMFKECRGVNEIQNAQSICENNNIYYFFLTTKVKYVSGHK